ncbi:MAG: hypothetical protein PHQ43_12205 [Dehalococcoidales bacterium]|nr:hypothetical protein [Dehalococcoidales bacterium]
MSKQRVVNKTVSPAEIARALQTGVLTTAQAQALYSGVMPIGDYKGRAAILDIDKLVNQPLIWAEKQWTIDVVDSRDGISTVVVPVGAGIGIAVPGATVITVPAGQVWYLTAMGLYVHQAVGMTGTLVLNLLVSSLPKVAVTGADKPYYDPVAVGDGRERRFAIANADIIGAPEAARTRFTQFQAGDELGVPLRAVGGDTFTIIATPDTAAVGVAPVTCDLTVYGRKAIALVS